MAFRGSLDTELKSATCDRGARARGHRGACVMQQEQKSLLKEQDQEIDKLGDAVKRVKALGGVMRDELSEQNVILDQLEEDVDRADSGMQTMQKKLRSMVEDAKNSDKAMYSIICCLLSVLAILTFMVLS